MRRFKNQIILITGGSQGIGKAIAKRILDEGGKVIVADINKEMLKQAERTFTSKAENLAFYELNIGEEKSVKTLAETISNDFGRLDVVINSAGVVGPNGKKITETNLEDFDNTYAVNLRGAFLVSKYFIPLMEQNNYGRILLIASIAGKEGNPGMCAYSSTKAGVIGLAKSIGKEYAETGIRINALAPAVIKTALVDAMNESQVKYMTDKIPMKRLGTLNEIAALVAFIVSPENDFTTGFTYDMSGGRATY